MTTKPTASTITVHCAFTELVDAIKLQPHPRNPNKHGDKQIALLAKIIRHQGWRAPIVVSKRSGFIVAGHGRLQAAQLLQVENVPVDYQDFATEADEYAHLVADNRIAELAEINDAELAGLLKELDGKIDLDLTGFDSDALAELGGFMEETEVDAEPQIDKGEELRAKWNVQPGQLWELGDHRLLCGDSTIPEHVAKLMRGEKAGGIVTDPPYGIGIDGQKESICKNPKHNRKAHTFMGWDSERPEKSVFDALLLMQCPTVIFGGNYFADMLPASRGWIYWGKGQDGLTMSDGELAWTTTSKPLRCVTVNRAALHGSAHPTQKPVEVIVFAINYIEPADGPIYEPFSGSGTTIIACEQLGRKCRAIEISPAYVAVALQRWADATGKTPKLING